MLILETTVLVVIFTFLIWMYVRKNRLGGMQWYPKQVQNAAIDRGLITQEEIKRRKKQSGILMVAGSAILVLGSVFGINGVREWKEAFLQIYLMVFVLNLFDAIFVDYLWVSKTSYWKIDALSDMEIAKPLDYLIKERVIAALVYVPLSALFACLVTVLK